MKGRRLLLLSLLLAAAGLVLWRWQAQQSAPPLPSSPPAPVAAQSPAPPGASSILPPLQATEPPPQPSLPTFLNRAIRVLPAPIGAPPLARRQVMPRLELPDRPAATLYQALRPAADAGNATAEYALAKLLSDCHDIPVDDREVEHRIEDVARTHWNIDTAVPHPAQFAADLRRKFHRCSGLDAAQRSGYYDWLRHAADAGQLDALENFELFDPPGDICRQYVFERCTPAQQAASRAARQVIAGYLLKARDAGSLNALWQLGSAYLDGELLAIDETAAYAHLLAYERASRVFGIRDPVAGLVHGLQRKLRPGDRAAAAEQARALLANPNCCVLIQ